MSSKYLLIVCLSFFALILFCGCQTTGSSSSSSSASVETQPQSEKIKLLHEYPDHNFNAKAYVQGMEKAGHNLLLWMSPAANLAQYNSFYLENFSDRLLPAQSEFSYNPYVTQINYTLGKALNTSKEKADKHLILKGEIVQCNPGNRAARYIVGFGAGGARGAVACELYEPGKTKPSIRIYAYDTASYGSFGGDSVAMLNHIFEQVGLRISNTLKARTGN